MCTESVSHRTDNSRNGRIDGERLAKYKAFSVAFYYPDDTFFDFFSIPRSEREQVISEYDLLFRAGEIWLYSTEHRAKHEFQRANYLSDIMGFYRAFGVEPHADRPDSLSGELEFMHFLIFKENRALVNNDSEASQEKAALCHDIQKKFFTEHLYPAAKKITDDIISQSDGSFYKDIAEEMIDFLESEKVFFERY